LKPRPTLLCATGPFYQQPLDAALETISKAGFTAAEVMVTSEHVTQDAKELRARAEDLGVEVAAIHAPFLLLTRRVFSTDPLEKIKRSVALAQEVGAPLVVVHPPYHWQTRYIRWLRSELVDFIAREQVIVAMENMFPVRVRGRGLRFHRTVGIEHLKRYEHVTLDTSHLAVARIDIVGAWDELADRVTHVHLSNNLGTGRDSHSPLREGVLPIGAFLERVGASRYAGTITLEIDVRPWVSRPAQLGSLLRDNREYCLDRLQASNARPARREI
jgi:sugar phosphate isomerase/epimerase